MLSRFENRVGTKELYRLGRSPADSVVRRHGKRLNRRAYRVPLDPTDDLHTGRSSCRSSTGMATLSIFSGPAFSSAFPPDQPALDLYPPAPGPRDFARFDVGSFFPAELLCFFKVDLLTRCDGTAECAGHR